MIARLEVLPGAGTAARFGEVVVWAGPGASSELVVFLVQSARNLGATADGGQRIADHLAGILYERRPEPATPFATVGPGQHSPIALLHGPVQMWDGSRWVRPDPFVGWMVVEVPDLTTVLVTPHETAAPPSSNPMLDLEAGVVPAGGLAVLLEPAPAALAITEEPAGFDLPPDTTILAVPAAPAGDDLPPDATILTTPAESDDLTPEAGAATVLTPVAGALLPSAPGAVPGPPPAPGSEPAEGAETSTEPEIAERPEAAGSETAEAHAVTEEPATDTGTATNTEAATTTEAPVSSGTGAATYAEAAVAPDQPPAADQPPDAELPPAADQPPDAELPPAADQARVPAFAAPPDPGHPPAGTSPGGAVGILGPGSTPPLGTVNLRAIPGSTTAPLPLADQDDGAAPGGVVVRGLRCPAGHLNHPASTLCHRCGRILDAARGSSSGPRPALGVLIATDGGLWRVDASYLIGTAPWNDPAVTAHQARALPVAEDGQAEPIHAELRATDWTLSVLDRHTRSGTFVLPPGTEGWQRVPTDQAVRVPAGSHLAVGSTVFTFSAPWPM